MRNRNCANRFTLLELDRWIKLFFVVAEIVKFFVNLKPCLIGIEACGSSHYWARKLNEFRHTVKPMAPQFVKPYIKTNKHDKADAEAICELHCKKTQT